MSAHKTTWPALAALFAREASARRLAGGEALTRIGDEATSVHLLTAGRLAALRPDARGRMRTIGYVGPGEIAGEMAVLAGGPRATTLVALRDSALLSLDAAAFFAAARGDAALMAEVAQLMLRRMRAPVMAGGPAPFVAAARTVALAAVSPGIDARAIAERLGAALRDAGARVAVLGADCAGRPERLAAAELACDHVLLAGGVDQLDWQAECRRQADRLLLLADGDAPPPADCAICATEPLMAVQLVDLLLWRRGPASAHAVAWRDATHARRLFHARADDAGDLARLARTLAGTAVGLVLSGGGARAFAHVGAVRALREAGVPIDAVGGTSMGSIIAAGVALGWGDAEMTERMHAAFVASSPMDDIAPPMIAMVRGRKVEARLAEHFGGHDIADLHLPFFCVSTNLTSGAFERHAAGDLVRALRASISLPGVLPPVILDDQVLVDGGILRNLPTDLMRDEHDGPIVAVDVSRDAGLTPASIALPPSWLRWFASGAWRRGPPIVSVLMRSATIASGVELAAARAAADLYVMPDVAGIEIRDWRAFDPAMAAGHAAMRAKLDALTGPVSQLRIAAAGMMPL